jgi:hypothetical protein
MREKHGLNSERGAALMMVLVISLLLGTACVALLAAVGSSSRNNTDALSEAKAYWAAESGLQRTINLLRHQNVLYSAAHNDSDLSTWLGTGRVAVGTEASYTMFVTDPDNTATATTFSVVGLFEQPDHTWAPTRAFTDGLNTTTISYEGVSNIRVTHPMGSPVSFGRFKVEKSSDLAPAPIAAVNFKLLYSLSAPASGGRTIRGTISSTGGITFNFPMGGSYELAGSTITICGTGSTCPTTLPAASVSPGALSEHVNGIMTPLEPFRLLVKATGYGPNSSQKVLEGVIQKNFFNGLGSDNAITLLGPPSCADVELGNSRNLEVNGGASPSIGVAGTGALDAVNDAIDEANPRAVVTPAPEIYTISELPDWQQSPAAMDSVVRQLRQTARDSGRYFTNGYSGASGWGNFAAGTGITFCEGNCTMSGNATGGGILVVTGMLVTQGNPSFRGLVLVTGYDYDGDGEGYGIERNGGGMESFIGTTIIAPYNPNNLAAGWGCPRYHQDGGAGETINMALDAGLNGTEAISNFMIGVAEK